MTAVRKIKHVSIACVQCSSKDQIPHLNSRIVKGSPDKQQNLLLFLDLQV